MPRASVPAADPCDPLAALRERFRSRTRQRLAALHEALEQQPPSLATVAAVAHQLAGSAGTFGYRALSEAAAALEDAARAAARLSRTPDPRPIERRLGVLQTAVDNLA